MVNLKKVWINQVYYSTQRRLEILKRRDPAEYRRTPFVEENRKQWEIFIERNLQKSRLSLLTADVKVCNNDSIENLLSIWTENAAKLTTRFFDGKSLGNLCICCRQDKHLTRAHLLHNRPELLKRAILEAPIIEDGHDCHISSRWFLCRYIELHKEFPIAPLCKECHEYIDK